MLYFYTTLIRVFNEKFNLFLILATADVDLVVDLQLADASKVISVLTTEGFKPKIPIQAIDFADEQKRNQWIKEKACRCFSLYHPDRIGMTVDLFVEQPIPYQDIFQRSVIMPPESLIIIPASG
jgi:hypothetical protein